ncbi:hypothetical protein V8G54_019660 [Vigna mungo]|uniref:Secreted protein n=1 Tax=Vigna mungo TaxID=3915 RepID=A0AAQ3NAJ5_VIGMU
MVTILGLSFFTVSMTLSTDPGRASMRWSSKTELTATASPARISSMFGSRSARLLQTNPRNSNWTPMVWANWANFQPTCCSASVLSGCGGPIPVRRKVGGPPGRNARACMRAGHCIPCLRPKSMTWTLPAVVKASRMAWLAVKCANFK